MKKDNEDAKQDPKEEIRESDLVDVSGGSAIPVYKDQNRGQKPLT